MIRFGGSCIAALLLSVLMNPEAVLGQALIRDLDPKQPGIDAAELVSDGRRVRHVRLNTEALAESSIILRLFDDANYRAQRRGGRRHLNTDVWVGQVEGQPLSSVIVSLHDSGVLFGKIEVGSRSFFIKHFSGAIYSVIERDPDLPEENEAIGDDFVVIGEDTIQGGDDFGQGDDQDLQLGKLDADSACLPSTSCPTQTIDIMVVYTAAARGALGGSDALAEAAISTAVAEMNTGLANAGVSHSFNLVFSGEVAYAESGDGGTDLSRLGDPGDGFLDIVHTLRDAYGADIVSLITDIGGCGIGYVPSTPTNLTPTSGFSVVRDDCLTGNKTLAHEVGHNMGLHHDWYVNSSITPCEWHHGYVNQEAFGGASNQRWRTIMAYNDQCAAGGFNCTRLTYYSNPNNTFNGDPMGIAQGNPNPADAAFGLERTACQIANHRPTVVDPGPVADFLASPLSGDPPLFVNFSDLSLNSPTSWSWDFGDGGSSTSQNPSHSYDAPGIYTVSLMASNSNGSDTMTKAGYVTVNGFEVATLQEGLNGYSGAMDTWITGSATTTNHGSNTQLETDGGPDEGTLFHWDVSSIPPGSQVTNVEVTVNVTNGSASSYDFYEMKRPWIENEATWLQYASSQSWQTSGAQGVNDRGSTVLGTMTATSSGTNVTTLNADGRALVESWIDAPSANHGLTLQDYVTSTDGIYMDSREVVTVANRPKLTIVYVPPAPAPPLAEFSADVTSGTAPLTVNFTDLSTNSPTSWSWDFGDTGSSTAQHPSHEYTTPGTYTVALTSTNAAGSDDEIKINYITVAAPTPPIAEFSADVTSGTEPLMVHFTDQSTNSPTSWSWDFGDTGSSTAQNPSHEYSAPGMYTVTLTATNDDGSDDELKVDYITVNAPPPVAGFTADVTSGDPPLMVNFTDQSTNSPTSWIWDFGDGGSSTSQHPSHNYTSPGIYSVTLTASNAEGSDDETKTGYIAVFGLVTDVFQQGLNGYAGARDTKIKSDFPTTNYGTDPSLEVDGSPDYAAILHWDISSIPQGAVVTGVDITLNVTDLTTDSYEFYEMKRAWVESQATFQVYATGQSWQTVGADGSNDRGSTVLGSVSGSTGSRTFSLNDSGEALVQGWVDNPVSNKGLILLDYTSASNGIDFDSKEAATVANRPKLSVSYSAGGNIPPTAAFEGTPSLGNAPLNVSFDASDSEDVDGTILTYAWDFGDGGMGSGVTTSHNYSAGEYEARLIVTDNDGASDTTYQQIHAVSPGPITFAVLGDFGDAGPEEAGVAAEVISWNPDFIITAGDNNYPNGEASTMDPNVGQYYSDFIYPYTGSYGSTATTNRFFPSLGNHDWNSMSCSGDVCTGAHFDYFDLPPGPGDERYYEFVWGDVHFFAVDSDTDEPDGTTAASIQGQWLQSALAASTAQWKLVYFHHAPYSSSSNHGSNTGMQWPFASWGADAVIAGHDHTYERIFQDGIVYFVNGLGGRSLYAFGTPIAGSQVRYNADYGAQLVTANADSINFKFINRQGTLIDSYTLSKPVADFMADLTSGTAPLTVNFTDQSTHSPTAWSWDFGDTGSSNVQNPSHEYTTPGAYTVSLTATNTHGSKVETKVDYITVVAPTPPVAEFTADTTSGKVPLTVDFTDLSTNTPTSWSWSFGDTGTSTEQNPSHEYTAPGNYTVTLTATNADGSDDETKVDYISVLALTPPVAEFTADTTSGKVPLTVDFTDLSTNTPTSWSWSFGDTGTSTEQNPSHEYTAPGNYTVTLTATNADGSDDETKVDYISVLALTPPVAEFTADTTSGKVPLTVDFTDLSTNTPTSWSWSFGDTGTSTEQNPSHEYTAPGNYTVTLTATNDDGSDGETKVDYISVLALTPPVAEFSADATSGKAPLTVNFTDLSTNTPTSWSWDFGDTGSSTEQNPSHEYSTPGLYTVTLTATNADGSDGETKVDYITVQALTPPVAEFSADPTSGKEPLTVNFTDLSTNTPTSWSWDFGDTGSSTEQNPSHEYDTPGTYTVSLTATNADGSDGETKVDYINVQALTPPVAEFSADPISGYAPLTVAFTDLSTNTPTSWSWDFGDTGTSTEQNPSHEYDTPGTYTVTLTATNADGSDDETKVDYITVESPFSLYYAQSETTPSGSQSGGYASTHNDDGTFEILTEQQSNGNPSSRTSLLDHRWTFNVTSGLSMLFRASAYRDDNVDGDDFTFEYSTDNATFNPLFVVDSSIETVYQLPVPSTLSGTVYVRVMDTNRSRGASSQDKVYVDHMYFEVLTSGIAPLAEFSASPTLGGAPLEVQFTDLSSYAPASWDWDFGDGESSADQNPTHTYASAGTFDVSLTVTNADGSDVEEKLAYISVAAWPMIHISDIVVSRTGNNWIRGTASVTVKDGASTSVSGATVEGVFSAPNPTVFDDLTDGSGVAMFQSDRTKTPPGNWCFEVTSVSKNGTVYDPGANVFTSRCEDGSSPDAPLASLSAEETVLGGLENHPNPFNPSTAVSFRLDRERRVRIEVFDQLGRRVAVLADEIFEAGHHTVGWDASDQATGSYFYRLVSEDYVVTRVMLLLK